LERLPIDAPSTDIAMPPVLVVVSRVQKATWPVVLVEFPVPLPEPEPDPDPELELGETEKYPECQTCDPETNPVSSRYVPPVAEVNVNVMSAHPIPS
jgi:hypothetical protein